MRHEQPDDAVADARVAITSRSSVRIIVGQRMMEGVAAAAFLQTPKTLPKIKFRSDVAVPYRG